MTAEAAPFERITKVRLPFDMRSDKPGENYGIHGLDVWFILKGPKGAVQFLANFGVYLPSVKHVTPGEIMGFDVGYHAPTPQYDGQRSCNDTCELVEGGICYYDGSSTLADEWAKQIFSTVGRPPDNVVWEMLEHEYHDRFGVDAKDYLNG